MTGAPDDPDSDSREGDLRSAIERVDDPWPDLPSAVERIDESDGVEADVTSEAESDEEYTVSEPVSPLDDEDGDADDPSADTAAESESGDETTDVDEGGDVGERVDHWPELPSAVERVGGGGSAAGAGDEAFPVVPEDPETPPENEPVIEEPQTAPDDEELPLAEHVEEMVFRAAIVVGVAGAISVLLYPFGDTLINVIWAQVLPGSSAGIRPHLYAPLDLVITQFKVASLAGIIVALPVFVYETYAFMRPGLYPHERRYYLAAVPTSLLLAVVGVLFAFFIVLPASFAYLIGYSSVVADSALALTSTFSMILIVMGYLALVFQLPLFIMLAIMMNLTTREWLESRRLLFWGAFVGVSFMFTSIDVSGVTPVLVAVTMILLFEGTLALLRWTGN